MHKQYSRLVQMKASKSIEKRPTKKRKRS
jgi:hypothetical protein